MAAQAAATVESLSGGTSNGDGGELEQRRRWSVGERREKEGKEREKDEFLF